ncbi:MAG: 3-hydroxyacyl-ACP dehydratase FabZ family protein [Pirellulaceae bacterium]
MRWFWIDRFLEFESGCRASAEKAVSLAEEQVDGYSPGFPIMPASLIIEGFAQTGGLLVGEYHEFRERTVLAKVGKAKFYTEVRPGDVIRYDVVVDDLRADGAIVHGSATVGGRLQSEVELVFAHLDQRFEGVDLFFPADFLAILRLLGVYDVGRKPDGTPLVVPPYLLEAENVASQGGK